MGDRVRLTLAPSAGLATSEEGRGAFKEVLGLELSKNRTNLKVPSTWIGQGDQAASSGVSLFNYAASNAVFLGDELDPDSTLESLGQTDVAFFAGRLSDSRSYQGSLTTDDCKDRASAKAKLNVLFAEVCSGLPEGVDLRASLDADRTLKLEGVGLEKAGVLFRLKADSRCMRLLRMPEGTVELSQSTSQARTGKWGREIGTFHALPPELAPFKILGLTHAGQSASFVEGHGFVNIVCELGEKGEVKAAERFELDGSRHLLQLLVVDKALQPVTFSESFTAILKIRYNTKFSRP